MKTAHEYPPNSISYQIVGPNWKFEMFHKLQSAISTNRELIAPVVFQNHIVDNQFSVTINHTKKFTPFDLNEHQIRELKLSFTCLSTTMIQPKAIRILYY